ncbi:MAG TPA: hypothetical protein VFJ16_01910 [Longimicrobium sp.]|nr:hypothetical protein [Longimicrobium sp.]
MGSAATERLITEKRDDLGALRHELDDVAREIARALTTPPVDPSRVEELDDRAARLRWMIHELEPPAPEEPYSIGSRLLSGG